MQGVQSLVQRAHRRGLVFVLSDLFAPLGYEEPLSALLHCQFEVQVLQVLALAGVREVQPCSGCVGEHLTGGDEGGAGICRRCAAGAAGR